MPQDVADHPVCPLGVNGDSLILQDANNVSHQQQPCSSVTSHQQRAAEIRHNPLRVDNDNTILIGAKEQQLYSAASPQELPHSAVVGRRCPLLLRTATDSPPRAVNNSPDPVKGDLPTSRRQ
jgi:hypothetical protein